jgi:hypothetical protein
MNTAVRDVQQSKQQFVVFLGLFARSAAPARLAAIVFAIAAFFAVVPHLYAGAAATVAKFVTPAEMAMLLLASVILLLPRRRRLQLARSGTERRCSSPLPGEVRGGA